MFDGFPPALEFGFYPFGNAYYNTSQTPGAYSKDNMFQWISQCNGTSPPAECFAGEPVCQHGPSECQANLIEACTAYLYPDPTDFGGFLKCFEGQKKSDPSEMGGCARYYIQGCQDCDKKITACTQNSTLATQLTLANAKQTLKLGASKLGTPWVLVNGEAVDGDDFPFLLQLVCQEIEGKKPKGCNPFSNKTMTAAQ
jgi:hypothetical protein